MRKHQETAELNWNGTKPEEKQHDATAVEFITS